MSRGVRTLPIRRWLALALLAIVFVPLIVTASLGVARVDVPQDTTGEGAELLERDVARWGDPAWREAAKEQLQARGVEFVLFDAAGRELYRTTPDPVADADLERDIRVVAPLTVSDVATGARLGSAHLYTNGRPTGEGLWLLPLVALATLLLTLGAVAWFLDRSVLKPLAATSRAARQVAEGDLDVRLPTSRVR